MKEAAHPLNEALAATLSKKKTVGQPVKNGIQSFVAKRTDRTSISYMFFRSATDAALTLGPDSWSRKF